MGSNEYLRCEEKTSQPALSSLTYNNPPILGMNIEKAIDVLCRSGVCQQGLVNNKINLYNILLYKLSVNNTYPSINNKY